MVKSSPVDLTESKVYAESWRETIKKGNEQTKRDIKKYQKGYRRVNDKYLGKTREEQSKISKDIAGKVLDKAYGTKGAIREAIEIIDKGKEYNLKERLNKKFGKKKK